ncbi:hypothetical protein [Dickeya undicola]|uniref:SLATT domain-containing protein n=1 Tax=Dickeya undicola TaxID=1577887 RepID=A0A3N0G038_9GAMM|nr:hypothetical protein [Dickeya undicola]RNM05803.1 hypothetical protein EF878_11200 [Dickeya undicola]
MNKTHASNSNTIGLPSGSAEDEERENIGKGIIKSKIQSSWGERIITTALLSLIPYTGIKNDEIIQKITPIISGIFIITVSIFIIYLKDKVQEAKKKNEIESAKIEFKNAKSALEEILESEHIDEKTRDINRGQINSLYIKRGADVVNAFNNRKSPEIFSYIGDTLNEMGNTINKKN